MKTLKTATVLLLTAALFFSCAQEDGNYGTLVINPSGAGSSRSITAEFDPEDFYEGFENDLTYTFECINQKDNTRVGTAQYGVKKSNDVQIQLLPGNWDVWVKVLKSGKEIGSNKYPTVAIEAGQTIILGGLNVEIQGYSYGSAVAHKAPEGFNYMDVDTWPDTSPININRHLEIESNGQAGAEIPFDENKAHGTANILWDENNLYVRVIVEGAECTPKKVNEELGNAHHTDSVEIFLNEGGIGYQYRIDYSERITYGRTPTGGSHANSASPYPDAGNAILLITKYDPPNGKYAVVAKIEFGSEKKSSDIIGIDLQINGAPEAGKTIRSSVAVWHETSPYDDPNKYNETLTLVD